MKFNGNFRNINNNYNLFNIYSEPQNMLTLFTLTLYDNYSYTQFLYTEILKKLISHCLSEKGYE